MTTFSEIAPAPGGPGDRGPLVGLRQLRHPVQGLRQPRAPRARSRRRSRTPRRCTGSPGSRRRVSLHIPWDLVDDYAALRSYAEDLGVALGTINSNTFQDDDYKLGALTHTDPKIRQKAIDHHFECIDVMNATGSRDLKIWLAEGTNYPGQGDMRGRQDRLAESPRDDLRADRRRPAAGARVQVLRAGVLPHRRPGLGHVVRPRGRPRRPGLRLPRHRPPRAGHQHRVHRRPAAAAREARLVRLQQPLLRRRRPDRRGGRPVPAVPDPVRVHARRRLRPRQRRGLHARPVPQHREEDPRPDPVGAQRPGDDGARAARRHATR